MKKPKIKLFSLEIKDWPSLMDWSDVKVSRDMHNGKERIIRNIDVTSFSASMFEFFWSG